MAQGAPRWPALNAQLQTQLDIADYQQALSDVLPLYRKLARDKYDLPAIHAFARNLAIINRAAQETVSILSRNGDEELLDAGAFYRSLISLGRVKEVPTDGLSADESKFLSLLQTAMLRSCHQRVAVSFARRSSPAGRDYLFAYLLATREPERTDRLLDDLPQALLTKDALQAFAGYCASVERKDLAAAVCVESGKRFVDEADVSAFCKSATDYYLTLNDVASAVEALRPIVARFPKGPNAPDTQIRIIDLIADKWKSYGTAVKECQVFLEKFPRSDKAEAIKLKIGYLYYQDKDYDRSIQYFDSLAKDLKTADTDVQRRFLLAFCYMGKGENDTAVEILNEIVVKHPEHPLAPRAQYVLAKTYLSRQDYAKAQDELNLLISLYPNSEYAKQADDLLQRLSKTQMTKADDKKPKAASANKDASAK
jgi:tetratricopeptide (TPR) repeat protein